MLFAKVASWCTKAAPCMPVIYVDDIHTYIHIYIYIYIYIYLFIYLFIYFILVVPVQFLNDDKLFLL